MRKNSFPTPYTRFPTPCGSHFPVPVSETVCGLLFALSFTSRVAVRVPVAVGVNVTPMVQVDLAGTLPPQLLDGEAKSPGSAPENVTLKVSAVLRLFFSVTLCAPLVVPTFCAANVIVVGVTVAWAIPAPVNDAVCGLFNAPSVTVSVPVSVPMLLGVNVTLMVQCPFAATLLPQVLVCV